jgi:hypothetical protein
MDPSKFVRDADYYLPDGDLVILVDVTLFKVRQQCPNVLRFSIENRFIDPFFVAIHRRLRICSKSAPEQKALPTITLSSYTATRSKQSGLF